MTCAIDGALLFLDNLRFYEFYLSAVFGTAEQPVPWIHAKIIKIITKVKLKLC